MKKISISIMLLSLVAMVGCEDFLDRKPLARENSVGYYESQANTEKAANSLYDVMGYERKWLGAIWAMGDCASDDAEVGGGKGWAGADQPSAQKIMLYSALPSEEYEEWFFTYSYIGIQRCNTLLSGTESADFPKVKQFRGEAYFMRAFYYFYMVNVFGPVPLFDHNPVPDEYATGNRADGDDGKGTKQMEKMYDQIVKDFQTAANHLPTRDKYASSEQGRATKGAAWAFLAKAYAFMASSKELFQDKDKSDYWRKVVAYTDSVKNYGGGYALVTDFHKLFNVEGENSTESIFEVQFIASSGYGDEGEGTIRCKDFTARELIAAEGPGYGLNCPTISLVSAYDIKDKTGNIVHWTPDMIKALDETTYLSISSEDLKYQRMINDWKAQVPNLVKQFDDYDPRLDLIAKPGDSMFILAKGLYKFKYYKTYSSVTNFWTKKAQQNADQLTLSDQAQGLNYTIYRYADLLLLCAEAKVNLGDISGATSLVNEIRNRARNSKWVQDTNQKVGYSKFYKISSGTVPADYTSVTLEDVQNERRLELSMEGHRFFDLVRWGIASNICPKRPVEYFGRPWNWKNENSYRLPLPTAAIIEGKGNVIQNPGY